MKEIEENDNDQIVKKLWTASGSLKGLGALFTQGAPDVSLNQEEFYGIGQLLKEISKDLEDIEDLLQTQKN